MAETTSSAATATATPTKRNNSHMSPPDKNVQTKITVLCPKFKDLFINTMRKEMLRQNDGYETEDEVPLSQLRKKVTAQRIQHKVPQKVNIDDSITITDDDLSQATIGADIGAASEVDKGPVKTYTGATRRERGTGTADSEVIGDKGHLPTELENGHLTRIQLTRTLEIKIRMTL